MRTQTTAFPTLSLGGRAQQPRQRKRRHVAAPAQTLPSALRLYTWRRTCGRNPVAVPSLGAAIGYGAGLNWTPLSLVYGMRRLPIVKKE